MTLDRPNNSELTKGVVAGGLLLIGLAAGGSPFFAFLVSTSAGVGGNLLANLIDKGIEKWRSGWLSSEGILNDPIKQALNDSFVRAVQELELEWKRHPQYHRLLYRNERERARASLDDLRELREDGNGVLQDHGKLSAVLNQDANLLIPGNNLSTASAARQLLNRVLDQYLGLVEPLADLAKEQLPDRWLLHFIGIIRSEEGTAAWRACQQLWQSSLATSIAEVGQAVNDTQSDVATVQRDVAEIRAWLQQWGEKLTTLPANEREITGEEALVDKVWTPCLETLRTKIDAIKADTELIIDLLKDRFGILDVNEVMTNFLQKELLHDQYVNLEQSGHAGETDDISLAKVFVDLPASDRYGRDSPGARARVRVDDSEANESKLPPGIIADILEVNKLHLDPESLRLQLNEGHEAWQRRLHQRKLGRFVLIGGPGQGKSTVSQFICQLFRAAILAGQSSNLRYEKVHQALREIEDLCQEEGIEYPSVPRFPIWIPLNEFADKLASENSEIHSILTYLANRIGKRTNRDVTTEDLRGWLSGYPWLIVLDGLDEVPASSNREEVLSAIDDFWVDVDQSNADVLVVATTRPQGYSEEFAPHVYQHKWLEPLSDARAMHYATRLVRLRYRQEQDRQERVVERLKTALQDQNTARLMRSPLQVTIMAALVARHGKPPPERYSLFHQYYDVIFSRETERNIPAASVLGNFRPDIDAIHYRVGLLLQMESEHSGQTGARLSFDRFADLVGARLREEGHVGEDLIRVKDKIIEAATDRLVFLVGVEAGEIGFEIRSLQEFMAAEALMDGEDALVRKRLREIAPIIHWRNVFLFAAGKCFAERQYLREDIRGVCVELNESNNGYDETARVTLAGSRLALDLLEDGPARTQPKYAKTLARLALRLVELPPNPQQVGLADQYDPSLEDPYHDELRKKLQGSQVPSLGAWVTLMHLSTNQVSWAQTLVDTHWPSSIDEKRNLAKAARAVDEENWFVSRVRSELVSLLSPIEVYDFLESQDIETVPNGDEDLSWVRDVLFSRERALPLALEVSGGEKVKDIFEVQLIGDSGSHHIGALIALSDESDLHPLWRQAVVAAKFVNNPSKSTLAEGLRESAALVSEHPTFLRRLVHWPTASQAWPLSTLLDTATSREELMEFADCAERGHYGDAEVWRMAEDRWMLRGVTINDLQYMTDDHWPFDQHIGRTGFPLYRTVFVRRRELRGVAALLTVFEDVTTQSGDSTRLRAKLAEWILLLLGRSAVDGVRRRTRANTKAYIPELVSFGTLQQLVREVSSECVLHLDFLETIDWEGISGQQRIDFLDYLGKTEHFMRFFYRGNPELSHFLIEAFTQDPTREGILVLLAKAPLIEQRGPRVPAILLDPARFDDPRLREAAIIVGLAQDEPLEARVLVEHATKLFEEDPYSVDHILGIISRHITVRPHVERFLTELNKCLPVARWETRRRLLDVLDDSSMEHTSQLKEAWSSLGLPMGLQDLVRT